MQDTPESARYHALDALRAAMMLLGVYLHAMVAYSERGSWPWKDGSATGIFDVSLGLIHLFRMPIFYVMAGFFSALLLERRGAIGFFRNRAVRIAVPFLVGWAVLFPLVKALALTGESLGRVSEMPAKFSWFFVSGAVWHRLDPMHLWFLEYLLIFYVVVLLGIPLARRAPRWLTRVDGVYRALLISPLGPLVPAVLTGAILCLMNDGAVDDPSGFVPDVRIAAAYFVFFGWGCLLWRNVDLLGHLRRPPLRMALSLAVAVVSALAGYLIWYRMHSSGSGTLVELLASAACLSLAMWLFVFGLVGAFLRLVAREVRWIRYLSDSSYWLYLVHMPVLLLFQIAIADTGWPPAAKALIVLSGSVVALLISYHFLVRPTWVGAILNGRRYPIAPRLVTAIAPGSGEDQTVRQPARRAASGVRG